MLTYPRCGTSTEKMKKFYEVFGKVPDEVSDSEWWDLKFVDRTSKCCDNCIHHNGTVLENLTCEAQHGIHDPRYQACIAFERRGL